MDVFDTVSDFDKICSGVFLHSDVFPDKFRLWVGGKYWKAGLKSNQLYRMMTSATSETRAGVVRINRTAYNRDERSA